MNQNSTVKKAVYAFTFGWWVMELIKILLGFGFESSFQVGIGLLIACAVAWYYSREN